MRLDDENIDQRIDEFFYQNLRELEADEGHALAPGVREAALNQVKLYYHRLTEIADRVTDTEVHLSLPGQRTPKARPFTIEGVVDIVRDHDETILYDIKTHDVTEVKANLELYERQLNVYAHIWQGLRGEPLDQTAVICTRFPKDVEDAISGSREQLDAALSAWDPVVPIPSDLGRVDESIHEFALTVDEIEDHKFDAPDLSVLTTIVPGTKSRFAVAICRNCDARFSCSSYRAYMRSSGKSGDSSFRAYLEDLGDDSQREEFVSAALDAADKTDSSV